MLSAQKKPTILLVDRENFFAQSIASLLGEKAHIVVVSKYALSGKGYTPVVYDSPIPSIPDGWYDSMLIVYAKSMEHILSPLLEKARLQQGQFFLLMTPEQFEQTKHAHQQTTALLTTLILGDFFGGEKQFPLDKLLHHAKTTKRLLLDNKGLTLWYPLAFTDAVKKIADLLENGKKEKNHYFLGPQHPLTSLSLAHSLQKIDPDIRIDFSLEETPQHLFHPPESLFPEYPVGKMLQNVYTSLPVARVQQKNMSPAVFPSRNAKKTFSLSAYFVYVLFVFLVFPFVVLLSSGGLGILFLKTAVQDIEHGDVAGAMESASAAKNCLSLVASLGESVVQLPGMQQVKMGIQGAALVQQGASVALHLTAVLNGTSANPKGEIEDVVSEAKAFALTVEQVSPLLLPAKDQHAFQAVQGLSVVVGNVIDELPQIIGTSQKRSYLILLQNNMELRPGGGFIGSYGIVHLQKGKVIDFSIHNVYDADGQLKGHVEPPFAIRRYMPLVHLYLRDSNFDPDFSTDAKTAAFLLSQETGEVVDGVLGIDMDVLQTFLKSTGPVYIPSYNQVVDKQNFFTLLETHAEKDSFAGSTQKQDFLNAVAHALFAKLQQKQFSFSLLLQNIPSLLQNKHLMIAFLDPLLEQPFALSHLSDTLQDSRPQNTNTFNDFFGIVEANIGVNKVNAFVSRSVSQRVFVQSSGDVQEEVNITYTNTSDGTWPGGAYKNYLRFILPSQATLTSLALDNVEQKMVPAITDPAVYEAKNFTAPKGLEVEKETEAGKSLYGFLVTVGERKSLTVHLTYTIPHAFTFSSVPQTYALAVWKQPGIEAMPYTLRVILPENLQLLSGSPVVNGSIAADTDIHVSFSQK